MDFVPIERRHLGHWHLLPDSCNAEPVVSRFAVPDELVRARCVLHGRVHGKVLLFSCE